ncbi:hypothetical protein B296_00057019, partial [Ensete ventricosum]
VSLPDLPNSWLVLHRCVKPWTRPAKGRRARIPVGIGFTMRLTDPHLGQPRAKDLLTPPKRHDSQAETKVGEKAIQRPPRSGQRDYHAIRMSSLPERTLDVPLEDLAPLTYEAGIWLDREALTKYIRAKQIPRLASDLYTLSSKVLMDRAVKAMVLSALPYDLIDWVHNVGRVVTSMDNRVDLLRKEVQRMKEGGDPDAVAVVEAQASEAQSLADNLQIELDEASRHRESMEMELGEAQEELANLRRQLADSQGKLAESCG